MEADNDIVRASWERPAAFAALFDRHAANIHQYAARRAGAGVAEDVVAETFLVAFERRHSYDLGAVNARPWLYGIAANLLSRHARQQERQWRAYGRHGSARELDEAHEEVTIARLDAEGARAGLVSTLQQLDPIDREVLLLHAWDELTYEEIATVLAIPLGTVRSKLHRSRARIRVGLSSLTAVPCEESTHG